MEGCSPRVAVNGVIGAPELLFIGHSHGTAGRLSLRVPKAFVLLGSITLCALILAFGGEVAQAQQLPPSQYTAIGEEAAGEVSRTPMEATPTGTSAQETRSAGTSPVEPASQPDLAGSGSPAGEPSPVSSDPALAEPGLPVEDAPPAPESVPGPTLQTEPVAGSRTVPAGQDGAGEPADPYIAPPVPESAASEPASGLIPMPPIDQGMMSELVDPERSPLDLEPEPVANEEDNTLPLFAVEAPSAGPAVMYSEAEDSYSLYVLGDSVVDAVETLEETLESAATSALGTLVDTTLSWPAAEEGEGLIDTPLASLLYEEEAGRVPASEANEETRPAPTGTGQERPLQDNGPQPVAPLPPPTGSSFSLSGGQIGAGSVALPLCILASALILLRREFKLLWAFSELPKPSSALLLPPERPG